MAHNSIWTYRPFLILQVELELGLGIWLLSGLFIKAAYWPVSAASASHRVDINKWRLGDAFLLESASIGSPQGGPTQVGGRGCVVACRQGEYDSNTRGTDEMSEPIRFSVVTVCLNAAATIERTIQSVVSQTNESLEYIVVDGGSTDGTLDIIAEYRDGIDVLISEKDEGHFDAMNKGVGIATGDVILFLNADDYLFHPGSIDRVAAFMDEHGIGAADVYHGSVLFFNYEKSTGFVWKSGPVSNLFIHREPHPHAATFYTRAAFQKNGLFDMDYPIAGDYEWTIRAFKRNGLVFQYMPLLVSVIAKGGISTRPENAHQGNVECRRALTSHFTPAEDTYLRILKRLRRKWVRLGRPLFQ